MLDFQIMSSWRMALPCCHLALCRLYPLLCEGRDLLHLVTCRQASGILYHAPRPSFRTDTTLKSCFPAALNPEILGPTEPLFDEKYIQVSSAWLDLHWEISQFSSEPPWHNVSCIETYSQEHGSKKPITEILSRQTFILRGFSYIKVLHQGQW